ncbi:MAG: TetR/AcrR family transcriptional regulator [Spirochaetales bacterium]|nr:TetR/AcrR family transcriptional regulator [Spirochaetales bacterium]
MQIPKDKIKNQILISARREFEEKGYADASIREIAWDANVSKSNIYNYFENKNILFTSVLEDTIKKIDNGLDLMEKGFKTKSQNNYNAEAQEDIMEKFMVFVFLYIRELKILLFKSAGSSLEKYKTQIIKKLAGILRLWFSNEAPEKELPNFFFKSIAGFYITTIEEIIAGDLTAKEAAGFAPPFQQFVYGGWKNIIQEEKNNDKKTS